MWLQRNNINYITNVQAHVYHTVAYIFHRNGHNFQDFVYSICSNDYLK